jgi:hypothetical protein
MSQSTGDEKREASPELRQEIDALRDEISTLDSVVKRHEATVSLMEQRVRLTDSDSGEMERGVRDAFNPPLSRIEILAIGLMVGAIALAAGLVVLAAFRNFPASVGGVAIGLLAIPTIVGGWLLVVSHLRRNAAAKVWMSISQFDAYCRNLPPPSCELLRVLVAPYILAIPVGDDALGPPAWPTPVELATLVGEGADRRRSN